MTLMTGHSGRSCVRCGRELTDAASMEAGIGPICRNLDNAILARLIPSNVGLARELLGELDLTAVAPETLPTMVEVTSDINGETPTDDWRKTVKRMEWALSYGGNHGLRPLLTKVVAALGYVGLAALWNGEAATGKATVAFLNGRLVVSGPRNKAANTAFKSITGRRFHPAKTLIERACWSFPASASDALFLAVVTHYPNHEGLTEAVAASKVAPVAVAAPVAAAPSKPAPKCSVVSAGVLLKVKTPYNPAFIGDLKATIKWADRRWNGGEKVWEVTANHEAEVKAMIAKHYGEAV
jgi:hypothetical protein